MRLVAQPDSGCLSVRNIHTCIYMCISQHSNLVGQIHVYEGDELTHIIKLLPSALCVNVLVVVSATHSVL